MSTSPSRPSFFTRCLSLLGQRVRWLELGLAGGVGVVVAAVQVLPWSEPKGVRALATLAVGVATLCYIDLVDTDRRGAKASHRVLAGATGGLAVAAMNTLQVEGYWLAVALGGALGYFGRTLTRLVRM